MTKLMASILAGAFMINTLSVGSVYTQTVETEKATEEVHAPIVATGRTLSEEQFTQTLTVLNALDVKEENRLEVWGSDIDRFTGNGSSDESAVYSSAKVEFKEEGFGVKVSVLTPDNITEVSAETYANAAITAGGQNLNISIANTVVPVNGRGALAGIYLALEHAGLELLQEDINIAELEVGYIADVQEQTGEDDEVVNLAIAAMKRDVATAVVKGEEITEETITPIITKHEDNFGVELPQETKDTLVVLLVNFSRTAAAQDKELETTLVQLSETILDKGGEALQDLSTTIDAPDNRNALQKGWDGFKGIFSGLFN